MKKFPTLKYPITPIIDEETYLRFCEWIEEINDFEFEDSLEEEKKYNYLDMLATLIEAYEAKKFKFNKIELTLTQVIEESLGQLNLSKKDLGKLIGSNRVSEIFKGKRQLSIAQIRTLHKALHIPTDLLIGL